MGNDEDFETEAKRLHSKLGKLGWPIDVCRLYAPLTLRINQLKKERNAVILAHSYQTPDIVFGVADFTGDSYGLSVQAKKTSAGMVVFSGVRFMAETAKIINPEKRVFLPSLEAGCSLADDITAEDVRKLKAMHPLAPVIAYVNTSAEVKAESDACCTSANAEKIIRSFPQKKVIFIPDAHMASNLSGRTGKEIVSWRAKCVVHQDFDRLKIAAVSAQFPGIKVLAHSECPPAVAQSADLMGSTTDMEKYVKSSDSKSFMLITECGMSDKLRAEFPDKEFVGMCALCPYMKKNTLADILAVLEGKKAENEIVLPSLVMKKAGAALEKMFALS